MAREKIDLQEKLREYKHSYDLLQKIPCTKEENEEYAALLKNGGTLPEGIQMVVYGSGEDATTEFCSVYEAELTEFEIMEYLTYRKLGMIRTIKNCVVFFTILTILGMIASFIILMNA